MVATRRGNVQSRRKGHCHAVVIRKRNNEQERASNETKRKLTPSAAQASSSNLHAVARADATETDGDSSPSSSNSTSPPKSQGSSLFSHASDGEGIGWTSQRSRAALSSTVPSSEVPSSATQPSVQRQKTKSSRAAPRDQDYYSISPTIERAAARAKRRKSDVQSVGRSSHAQDRRAREQTPPSPAAPRHSATLESSNTLLSAPRPLPERPQSAMKHRSANVYSSGRASPLIVMSSNDLPSASSARRQRQWTCSLHASPSEAGSSEDEAMDDADAAVFGSRKIGAAESLSRQTSKRQSASLLSSDSSASSKLSPLFTSRMKRNDKDAFKIKNKPSAFVLRSRTDLPESDFYARTKEEERSPTPIRRKNLSM